MNRDIIARSGEDLSAEWREVSSMIEWEGGALLGDRVLQSLFERIAMADFTFRSFLRMACVGDGFGDEGAIVSPPSKIIDIAYEDGVLQTDYFIEVSETEFGDDASPVMRMPVSRFLAHVSLAVSFHSRFVDETLDVWDTVHRISVGYSRENQLAKLRPDILLQLLYLDTEWTNGITRRELAMAYAAKE